MKALSVGRTADGQGKLWFSFWVYVAYPIGILYSAVVALAVPAAWFFVAVLLMVAAGLHRKQLWAWQANWLVLFGNYGQLLLPTVRETMPEDQWIFSLIIGAGFLVANWVYWTKRKAWFKHSPGQMLIWRDAPTAKADAQSQGAQAKHHSADGSSSTVLFKLLGVIIVFYVIFLVVGIARA